MLLTAVALALSIFGGHPESAFHGAAAGAAFFLWELFGDDGGRVRSALAGALAAAVLALLLAGPQLFPLLEAIPHSAEYRVRKQALRSGEARQSVALPEAASRLLPDLLPFAHGIFGKSPVQTERKDGSGMPLGYAGAVLLPLAGLAFRGPRSLRRERIAFSVMFAAGLLYGASVPGLIDVTSRLPGFRVALNYRLIFLAALGLAGLAAIGAQRLLSKESARSLAWAASGWTLAVAGAFLLSRGVFRDRGLADAFVLRSLALEAAPLLMLAALARVRGLAGAPLAACALGLLVVQRGAEMAGTYPTLPPPTLRPPLPTLSAMPLTSDPCRVVALGDTLRPNGSTLYRVEDVRGYESLVLARFTDTYPLWCSAQAASFNRVTDLSRPFLSFLNACYAIGAPDDPVPQGWREQARGGEMAIFANPGALPRAFVPRRLRRVADPGERLAELARATDFAQTAWVSTEGPAEEDNGEATVFVRAVGPDLVMDARVSRPALIATSIPDWPGWIAREGATARPTVTVNHAFVGIMLPAGNHVVRLQYRPRSWRLGVAAFAVGVLAVAAAVIAGSSRRE